MSDLMANPRESMDIECKDWLDLTDSDVKAGLAKEIIALANYGGGYILCGFKEDNAGNIAASSSRPENLNLWSQDAIQDIVKRYIDPQFQCQTVHQKSAADDQLYPVIIVPGGHRSPVRARASSPNGKKLVAHRTYIRRSGPSSEEPQSAREWDELLERCLQNRQDTLVDAMRSILAGVIPGDKSIAPSRMEVMKTFIEHSRDIWGRLVEDLPSNAGPRFPHGYYEIAFAIDGSLKKTELPELRQIIDRSIRSHSGWPPFLTLENRTAFQVSNVDDAVQFWKGPDERGKLDIPGRSDFWRISPEGLFYTRCGYRDDAMQGDTSLGRNFDVSFPTWRVGEAILEASYIARALNAEAANLLCFTRWTSLDGRTLTELGWNPHVHYFLRGDERSAQRDFETTAEVALSAIPSALPELVFGMIAPLLAKFSFFSLERRFVEVELSQMQARTFRN